VPSLTAIVPATDAPPTLERCLAAIRAAAGPPEELLVVERPVRAGPARARNAAARRARGEVLVFVDADVLVHPDAFARIRAAFDRDTGLTAVFGSYDDRPEADGTVSGFRNLLHHHVHQASAGPATTFWAGLGAVRRVDFVGCGGFDAERYSVASIEDIELGGRLAARGGRIELDPALQGTHLKRWSLRSMVRTDFARRGVPWVTLLLRSRAVPAVLNLGWRNRLSAAASLFAAVALARRRPWLAAGSALVFVAPNLSFYALLARRRGRLQALVGVGLHAVHHLAGIAAIPAGVAAYLAERGRSR